MRQLSTVTTVVPAIAKADSLTQAELASLRADVAEAIEVEGIPVVDLAGEVNAARQAAAAAGAGAGAGRLGGGHHHGHERGRTRTHGGHGRRGGGGSSDGMESGQATPDAFGVGAGATFVEGSDSVLALVGGTVFEGGRAARVYPWGACLPGGGAAMAPADLSDLVSALTSAEGVALLKARTETATSSWAAAAIDGRAARQAAAAAAAAAAGLAERGRGGGATIITDRNGDGHPTLWTPSKHKGRWLRLRGGVEGIRNRIFWGMLLFLAMFRAALTRVGGASGGGGGGGDGAGPAGGWLRTARRQRAAREAALMRDSGSGGGGEGLGGSHVKEKRSSGGGRISSALRNPGGAWDVALRALRGSRLARLGLHRGIQGAAVAAVLVFSFGAALLAALPSDPGAQSGGGLSHGGLMLSSGVKGVVGGGGGGGGGSGSAGGGVGSRAPGAPTPRGGDVRGGMAFSSFGTAIGSFLGGGAGGGGGGGDVDGSDDGAGAGLGGSWIVYPAFGEAEGSSVGKPYTLNPKPYTLHPTP
jgi:hypothetical protein